ncbi:MAG TPA: hypothetical protein VKI20_10675 [Acidimicrobiales bacterium]|nr:hypothetical protein [Acidimicrobiales bacterium]
MRLPTPSRRRLTALERLLGKRRARRLRRRLGLVALGTGLLLLRPRRSWAPVLAAVLVAAAGSAAIIR